MMDQTYKEIAQALAGARNSGKLAQQLSDEKGVSVQTIYTWAKLGGFTSGRKRREDAGTRKLDVTEEQLAQVACLIHQSHTEKDRIPLTAHQAISYAETNGILPAGLVSETYLNAWMRSRKVSKKHALLRTPHTPLMSKYPNHIHMVDASTCAQWFLKQSGEIGHQRRGLEVYKNKDGNSNKITRLVLVDHYSGAFFVRYYQSETARDLIEFLYLAWADKSVMAESLKDFINADNLSEQFPFSGMPDILYTDNGAANKAIFTLNVLSNLNIIDDRHKPYMSRAKGANETMQRHWERWFEADLKYSPASSLDELNAWAFDRCRYINAKREHSRHGHTRFDMWSRDVQTIKAVPDYQFYCRFAISQAKERKVGFDGLISFKPDSNAIPDATSGKYHLPDTNLWGTWVEVNYCLFDYPKIRVVSRRTGQLFELTPLLRNSAGFYPEISATLGETFKSPAYTDSRKAFAEMGMDENKFGHLTPIEPITLDNVHGDNPETPSYEPAAVVEFQPMDPELIRTYTRLDAKKRLMAMLGAGTADDLYPAQRDLLATLEGDIREPELQALYQQLKKVDDATIINLTKGEQFA